MKTLLAIAPSPRRGGNTDLLLEEFGRAAAEAGWKVETIRVNDLDISPCQACDTCSVDGVCILDDDMKDIYGKIAHSDALIVASPITFGSMIAQLKIFIDRFQCWWHAKYNLKKPLIPEDAKHPGFFICVGAIRRKEYCESAAGIVRVFFHNINHRLTGALSFRGYDAKGDVLKDPAVMKETYRAAQEFLAAIDDQASTVHS